MITGKTAAGRMVLSRVCAALIWLIGGWPRSAVADRESTSGAERAAETIFPDAAPDSENDNNSRPEKAELGEEWPAVRPTLQAIEKRLANIENRLGAERRPTTVVNTIERRLADIERRLDRIERNVDQFRQFEQRLRRLEMQ